MGQDGERRLREWLNVSFNALMFLVMLTMLILTVQQVLPFLSEKMEILVRQEDGYKIEWSPAGSSGSADSREWVVLSIPFEIRIVNVGKTDVVLRQPLITVTSEKSLPLDCAYEFVEAPIQEYFEFLTDDTPQRFPIHLTSGISQTFVTWLMVAVVGNPARSVWGKFTESSDEVAPCVLASWVKTALARCEADLKVQAMVSTGQRHTFSSAIVVWRPPFVSCPSDS